MSTISHEMRTPMNGVIGSLDLLQGESLSGSAAGFLAMARQSADSMVELIDQLLSFNTVNVQTAGTLHNDYFDLKSLLLSLIAEQQPLFTRKAVTLSLQMADNLPRMIWSDREKICRLMEILLGNALKFTAKGAVTLAASLVCTDGDADMLYFTVTDSGIGIPEGMLERIFEPFVQGDGSLTRRYEGAGLGLAIARQNALLLNGHLWAEHVPDGGSRFSVTLPLRTP
jgi:signal transduction histidine kinase